MPTERKFAISTTPGRPGYEATYATFNDLFTAVGNRDLPLADEKITIEVFDEYDVATPNFTGVVNIQGWKSVIATGHFIEIKPVAGSKFVYPALTGSRLVIGANGNMFESDRVDADIKLVDLGIFLFNPDTTINYCYAANTDTNSEMDRCYHRAYLYNPSRWRLTSNTVFEFNSNYPIGVLFQGNYRHHCLKSISVVLMSSAIVDHVFRRCHEMYNVALFHQPGAAATGGAFTSSIGDYNASSLGGAPGPNSINTFNMVDECVSLDDCHLLETSQLRDAGENQFGNGFDKDIDGDDRPNAPWDLGADQFVVAAPTPMSNALMHGMEF